MGYRLTARTRRDVRRIWTYIAEDSEAAADRLVDLLVQHFRLLGDNPHIGRRRDELRAGTAVSRWVITLIFYRIGQPGVRIMHVVHGRRDPEALFRR
jgi:plasmid stabilization system protein ParE